MIFMPGFIKSLFSKPEPEPVTLLFDEVGGYLDRKENEAALIVETAAERARAVCTAGMEELYEKVQEIGKMEVRQDSHPHPKVRTVAEKSIPRFISAMEKALSQQLTSDPELMYEDIIALIRSLADAMKKHGRYIAVVFPDDMKSIKSSLDHMGKALNSMTEEVRPAVEIRGGVSRARPLYQEIKAGMEESALLEGEILSMEDDFRELEAGVAEHDEKISSITSGQEYSSFISTKNRLSALREEQEEIVSGFEHLRSSCINVFRKSAYIAEKDGNTALAREINRLMEFLSSPGEATADAVEIYQGIYPSILAITKEHDGILKNSDEIKLFSSGELFPSRLSDIISEYMRVDEEIYAEKAALEGSGLAGELKRLESEKEKLLLSLDGLEERINDAEERRAVILSGMPGRFEELRSALTVLEGADVGLETGGETLPS